MIKTELINRIMSYYYKQVSADLDAYSGPDIWTQTAKVNKDYVQAKERLELCTIDQLWSLYKMTENKSRIQLLPCNPSDHLAVGLFSCLSNNYMYIGIEPDGS